MPLISTRGAASAQGFGEFAKSAAPVYIEDVFSTYLYTGNGSTQAITNGIDLSGKGGLAWMKGRSDATDHALYDTTRGATKDLVSNSTAAETTEATGLTAFSGTGFSIGALAKLNTNAATYASWTFRKQPKFFDVVTFTAPAVGVTTTVSHSLGSTPGCIIMKSTTNTANWVVLHRYDQTMFGELNTTAAFQSAGFNANFTTTSFDVKGGFNITANSGTYIAYIFAHNAGGFGLSGTDNVISCGSFTADGSGNADVTLGYEPQWLLVKAASDGSSWSLADIMRGMPVSGNGSRLFAQSSSAESLNSWWKPNATGFTSQGLYVAGTTVVYIAIRRGPMKVPTSGTSVFSPIAYSGANGAAQNINAGFPVDADIIKIRNDGTRDPLNHARLMGGVFLKTDATSAEASFSDNIVSFSAGQNVIGLPVTGGGTNEINGASTSNYVAWAFRRAPGFFDVVCYTGTGSARTVNHNLAAVPEFIIVKQRATGGTNWRCYHSANLATNGIALNLDLESFPSISYWNDTAPTSSVFSVGTSTQVNASGGTYIAYLFATVAGVSKVGSYTGSGTTKQIDCGFTAGARFVLIKRTDSTGDWYVYDSARGIVAGNDPYLFLNSTAAEVTSTDYVDTYSAGFELSSTAPAGLNANGGTYIFLAIA